jgi:hypothetical protein
VTAPPFVPTDLPGLVWWLAADFGTYQDTARSTPAVADGAPVQGWTDRSPAARHVIQPNASQALTLKLAIQNGRSILRLDGVDDALTLGSLGTVPGAAFTVFVVHKTSGDGVFMAPFSGNGQVRIGQGGANALSLYDGSNNPQSLTIPTARTVWSLAEYQTGTPPHFWAKGVNLDNGGVIGSIVMDTLAQIAGGSLPLGGDFGEIVVYNTTLNSTDRVKVETYLINPWAL